MGISRRQNLLISIIIPVEHKTEYLMQALKSFDAQKYRNFEVLISSTKPFTVPYPFARVIVDPTLAKNVSGKRNKIIKYGKGRIFILHDDDVFAPPHFLESVVSFFENKHVFATAGPLLTPPHDSFLQQASGAVWESFSGSFGAGLYRSRKEKAQIVYDYPAANLIVRKEIFSALGGFESGLYPGEDTKWCLLLFNRYQKGIYYDSKLFVYHHRKPLFIKHLQQIGRYGNQRGWFALSYPETSFRLQYFLPTLFLIYSFLVLFWSIFFWRSYPISGIMLLLPLGVYVMFLGIDFVQAVARHNILIAGIMIPGIILTHWYYGYRFLRSFLTKIMEKIQFFLSLPKRV